MASPSVITWSVAHGLDYRRRSWGKTESLEFLQGGQKQFFPRLVSPHLHDNHAMVIDRSVYPDVELPTALTSPEDRADFLHRICAAFDFEVFRKRPTG